MERYEKYDKGAGIIQGPFPDCNCPSHHQHGRRGAKGCNENMERIVEEANDRWNEFGYKLIRCGLEEEKKEAPWDAPDNIKEINKIWDRTYNQIREILGKASLYKNEVEHEHYGVGFNKGSDFKHLEMQSLKCTNKLYLKRIHELEKKLEDVKLYYILKEDRPDTINKVYSDKLKRLNKCMEKLQAFYDKWYGSNLGAADNRAQMFCELWNIIQKEEG